MLLLLDLLEQSFTETVSIPEENRHTLANHHHQTCVCFHLMAGDFSFYNFCHDSIQLIEKVHTYRGSYRNHEDTS